MFLSLCPNSIAIFLCSAFANTVIYCGHYRAD